MTQPPKWLLALLLVVTGDDSFDPVAGDLLEDYELTQVPQKGSGAANLWLLRQALSLVPNRLLEGRWPMRPLSLLSIFMIFAGVWLAYMEQVLRHPGHLSRTLIDIGLVLGSQLILAWVLRHKGVWLQSATGLYALAALALSGWVLWRLFHTADFEGFALVIAAVLGSQALLVFASFIHLRRPAA